jgi:DNA polymerase-3 subunit delta'
VPGFESIIDQDRPIRILTTFLQKGTVPHALLFTGIEGVGKQNTAVAFAMACNCTGDNFETKSELRDSRAADGHSTTNRPRTINPCGNCKSCRKIESGNHPDIIRIKPSGASIKINQIRTLCQTLTMKPYEAGIRVVLISDAQALNPAAGNALLKVLEEPPTGTILILVASHTSDLLPTIVSRCRHIRFNPISRTKMESILVSRHGFDPQNAMIIAAMAGGSFSRALHMYRTNWINRRTWLISELDSLSSVSISRLLAFGDQLAKNKDALPDALEVMKSWLRDLVIGKFYPEKIIHQDLTDNVHRASQKMSTTSLLSKFETIQSTQIAIQAGTNLRLAMETMVLKLSRI